MRKYEEKVEIHSTLELDTRSTQHANGGTAAKESSGQLLDHSELQPYHPRYIGWKGNESVGLEAYRPGWTNEDNGIILAVAEEENGIMVVEEQDGYNQEKNENGERDMSAEKKSKLRGKRICGLPAMGFLLLLTLILISIVVGVVAGVLVRQHKNASKKYGAYITDCSQSKNVFYVGAQSGACYRTKSTDGFEVDKLKAKCTVTVYTDIYCSYNATGCQLNQCYTGYESFSVDTCW